jgi:nucleotide-binding universal stress UspA family protein
VEQADLLILGDARDAEGLLAPTAARTSRAVEAPVLVLRAHHRLTDWLAGARPLRVLVGVDAGLASQAARGWTASLSQLGPCEVHLVHACVPVEVHERLHLPPPRDVHSLSDEARLALERELDRQGLTPAGWTRRVVASDDHAGRALVALAAREDADLVVVGQRQKSWLDRVWTGSVSDELLLRCPVSVATVPAARADEAPAARAPAVIVVATDFSPAANEALRQARALVPPGGVLHLVHVLPSPLPPAARVHERAEAWRRLKALPLETSEGRTAHHHVLEGDAASQVLALASRCGAELIVLGTSQQGLAGLLGSVSQTISRQSRVPVLLAPAASP